MKNEKGITLIALIVYVMLMTFIVGGVTAITTSFRSNVSEYDKTTKSAVAFSKFNMYLIKDIKSKNVKLYGDVKENEFQLQFKDSSGNATYVKYSVQNNILYRNSVKICDNVRQAIFSGSGRIINVSLLIGNFSKTTTYAIESKTA